MAWRMPRYYFEIESETTVYEDGEGELYPNNEAALASAQRLASGMSKEDVELAGGTLRVLSETDEILAEFVIPPTKEQLQ